MPSHAVPTYTLYGEFLSGTQSEPVHHETVRERSSIHEWEIKQHRHARMAQVFLFETPGVLVHVGDSDFLTAEPTVLMVPPMITHGFRFPQDMLGDVLSFPVAQMEEAALRRLRHLSGSKARITTATTCPQFAMLRRTVDQIAQAFRSFDPDREALLKHLTQCLFIYLRSGAPGHVGPTPDPGDLTRHEQQAQAFCRLIETGFATDAGVTWYADALGVSSPHLTRISRRILGATPNALITRRRLIEAERLLKFTRQPIADIALRAGYRDAPYFNRVFRRKHGVSPGQFRKAWSA